MQFEVKNFETGKVYGRIEAPNLAEAVDKAPYLLDLPLEQVIAVPIDLDGVLSITVPRTLPAIAARAGITDDEATGLLHSMRDAGSAVERERGWVRLDVIGAGA